MSEIQKTSIHQIQRATCEHFRVGRADMISKSRTARLAEPRNISGLEAATADNLFQLFGAAE